MLSEQSRFYTTITPLNSRSYFSGDPSLRMFNEHINENFSICKSNPVQTRTEVSSAALSSCTSTGQEKALWKRPASSVTQSSVDIKFSLTFLCLGRALACKNNSLDDHRALLLCLAEAIN